MKFGHFTECNMRKIFLEKSYAKFGGETSSRLFSEKRKLSIYITFPNAQGEKSQGVDLITKRVGNSIGNFKIFLLYGLTIGCGNDREHFIKFLTFNVLR